MTDSLRAREPFSVRRVFSDGGLLLVASSAIAITGLVRTKLAAETLPNSDFSLVSQASQFYALLIAVATVGLVTGVRVQIARSDDLESAMQAAAAAIRLVVLISVVVSAFAVLTHSLWSQLLLGDEIEAPSLMWICPALIPAAFSGVAIAIAQGSKQARQLVATTALGAVLGSLAVVLLTLEWQTKGSLSSFLVAGLIQASCLVGIPAVRKALRASPTWTRSALKPLILIGVSSFVLAVAAGVSETLARGVLVAWHGLDAVASYQPAYVLINQVFTLVLAAMATSLMVHVPPVLADDRVRLIQRRKFNETISRFVAVITTCALLSQLLAGPYVAVLFSRDLTAAPQIVRWEAPGIVLMAATWALGAALLPLGKTRAWLLCGLLTATTYFLSGVLLIPERGAVSFPLMTFAAWFVGLVVTCLVLSGGYTAANAASVTVIAYSVSLTIFNAATLEWWGKLPSAVLSVAGVAILWGLLRNGLSRDPGYGTRSVSADV